MTPALGGLPDADASESGSGPLRAAPAGRFPPVTGRKSAAARSRHSHARAGKYARAGNFSRGHVHERGNQSESAGVTPGPGGPRLESLPGVGERLGSTRDAVIRRRAVGARFKTHLECTPRTARTAAAAGPAVATVTVTVSAAS